MEFDQVSFNIRISLYVLVTILPGTLEHREL